MSHDAGIIATTQIIHSLYKLMNSIWEGSFCRLQWEHKYILMINIDDEKIANYADEYIKKFHFCITFNKKNYFKLVLKHSDNAVEYRNISILHYFKVII